MTKPELYRFVFKTPEGQQVLADLAGYAERLDAGEPGSKVIAHIARMMNSPDVPAPSRARVTKASGGRIQHG